jgi:hypothetical protein
LLSDGHRFEHRPWDDVGDELLLVRDDAAKEVR